MNYCRLVIGAILATQAAAFAQDLLAAEIVRKEVPLSYPKARRVEQKDVFHGVEVADPYRWLEENVHESEEVAAWIDAQNELTQEFLGSIESRSAIKSRLTELWDHARYSAPYRAGRNYFFRMNPGLRNQPVLYVSDTYDGESRVLIDPNGWSDDGTVSLGSTSVSDDGKLLAYTVSESGSDWKTIRVLNVLDGSNHADEIRWIRWGGIAWAKDGSGFFYSRYPTPDEDRKFQAVAQDQMVYFHKLGTPQEDDKLIHKDPENSDWSFSVDVTDDGNYLIRSTSRSTDPQNQFHVLDLRKLDLDDPEPKWLPIVDDFDHQFSFVGNVGERFYFRTDYKAPMKRLVAIEINDPSLDSVIDVIPASKDTLRGVSLLSNRFVANYLRDATTRVRVYSIEGNFIRDVQLPGVGSASGFGGRQEHTETFFSFTNYATPSTIYRYDVVTGESTKVRQPKVDFDPEQFVVKQVFATSKDGTKIPIFIAHLKGTQLDGNNPTLLYGYGGFNISLTPSFSVGYLTWMEMGGVLAIANLRGGGEYGEPWHLAGKNLNKQNVFDDFISSAEWLIAENYTSTQKLAVMGGSNGGLLVGAVTTQRPDLFRACLPAVGVMDMLRYHTFTAGVFWRDEYGTVDNKQEFQNLLRYSPYHNLRRAVLSGHFGNNR